MTAEQIDITYSLEPDEDWPVADICFRGVQWASATLVGEELVVTLYGGEHFPLAIPLEDALASLLQAKARLLELVGRDDLQESTSG